MLSGCQSSDSPGSSSASSGSLPVSPTPFVSSSASDESERFVVNEVDDGLQVEWVSTDVSDTSFEGTYRVTNMTGEDVWLAPGSYVVPDASNGGYAIADVFIPPDPNTGYYVPPTSPVFLLEAGESRDEVVSLARPFELTSQTANATPAVVAPSSVRMCEGYLVDSELPDDRPAEGLYSSSSDLAIEDSLGFRLQHVSCSESIDLE